MAVLIVDDRMLAGDGVANGDERLAHQGARLVVDETDLEVVPGRSRLGGRPADPEVQLGLVAVERIASDQIVTHDIRLAGHGDARDVPADAIHLRGGTRRAEQCRARRRGDRGGALAEIDGRKVANVRGKRRHCARLRGRRVWQTLSVAAINAAAATTEQHT